MHSMISLSDRLSTEMANVDKAWPLSRRTVESILAPQRLMLGKPRHRKVGWLCAFGEQAASNTQKIKIR